MSAEILSKEGIWTLNLLKINFLKISLNFSAQGRMKDINYLFIGNIFPQVDPRLDYWETLGARVWRISTYLNPFFWIGRRLITFGSIRVKKINPSRIGAQFLFKERLEPSSR